MACFTAIRSAPCDMMRGLSWLSKKVTRSLGCANGCAGIVVEPIIFQRQFIVDIVKAAVVAEDISKIANKACSPARFIPLLLENFTESG